MPTRIVAAALSYERNQREEFGAEHDHFRLVGQDNVRRYLPVGSVRVRVHASDTAFDLFARVCAAHVAGCRVVDQHAAGAGVAAPCSCCEELTESWAGAIEFVEETDAQLAQAIRERQADRVRYAAPDRAPLRCCRRGNAVPAAASSACRCRAKAGSSCSGTCASRASAPTTTATATSASGPTKSVPR